MPTRGFLLTDVKFVFGAQVTRHRGGKPVHATYIANAHAEVSVVRRSEMGVAYSIQPGGDRRPFVILMHGGRLYWPALQGLGGHAGSVENRLRRLLHWRWDVEEAAWPDTEPPSLDSDLSWRRVVESGEQKALTLLHRRAASCLVVDGEVYAEGGVPLALEAKAAARRRFPVLSSGTTRAVLPSTAGLGWQPGSFHLDEVHYFLAAGRFSVPCVDDPPGAIVVHTAFPVDPLEVRIDATVRVASHVLQGVAKKRRIDPYTEVVDKFLAAEAGPVALLTQRRCKALQFLMETGESIGLNFGDIGFIVATLEAAAGAGLTWHPELTEEESEALANLAG
jgi:hypothetical protein